MGTIKSNNLSAEESLQENGANYRLLVKNLPNVVFKGHKDWSVDFIDDKPGPLFRRFDSDEVVEELLNSGFSLGGKLVEATVLFSDIRSFTTIAESPSPEDTIELLNAYFFLMIDAIANEGGSSIT